MIAVVPGDAALVELEPDAPVGGDPGLEVRDADGDVIDAGKNGRASSRGAGAEEYRGSVEWLYLHDPVVVVAADPERRRRRRVVDEHRAHIGVGRHQVLHRVAGLGIEPYGPVGVHRRRPDFAVLVDIGPVRIGAGRQVVLREFFRPGVEYRDLVTAIFSHHDPV